jgi:hypothetical protein
MDHGQAGAGQHFAKRVHHRAVWGVAIRGKIAPDHHQRDSSGPLPGDRHQQLLGQRPNLVIADQIGAQSYPEPVAVQG